MPIINILRRVCSKSIANPSCEKPTPTKRVGTDGSRFQGTSLPSASFNVALDRPWEPSIHPATLLATPAATVNEPPRKAAGTSFQSSQRRKSRSSTRFFQFLRISGYDRQPFTNLMYNTFFLGGALLDPKHVLLNPVEIASYVIESFTERGDPVALLPGPVRPVFSRAHSMLPLSLERPPILINLHVRTHLKQIAPEPMQSHSHVSRIS